MSGRCFSNKPQRPFGKVAANHEHEPKEGVWFDLIKAMVRKKINEDMTDEHRNALKKIVVEGGWAQKRLYDVGWSNEDTCQGCNKEEGAETQVVSSDIPADLRKWEQRSRTSKKDWKCQRGIATPPLSESK